MAYNPTLNKFYKYAIDTTAVRALGASASGSLLLGSFTNVSVEGVYMAQTQLLSTDASTALTDFYTTVGYTAAAYNEFGSCNNMHTATLSRNSERTGSDFSPASNPHTSLDLYASFTAAGGSNMENITAAAANFLTIWVEVKELP